jgi:GNAT superfamily N-acetyltransferase
MKITLQPARVEDTTFARTIHHLAYHDVVVHQFGTWDEDVQDGFFGADWAKYTFEVIGVDGSLCGYACIEDRAGDVHVRELVIHPAYQGRGIGRVILQQTMARAKGRGVPVRLGVLLKNRARVLYERLGFRETGRTDTHILMEWCSGD